MLSRSTCVWSCMVITAALVGSLVAGCAIDADEPSIDEATATAEPPPVDDEPYDEPLAAEDVSQADVAFSFECTNDAGCPQGFMCVKPAFKKNWCAQLCVYDAIGEHNCGPGYDCTRPFPYTGRYRCTPD